MKFLQRFYDWLFGWTTGLQSVLLFTIRIVWGTQFFLSGFGKLNTLTDTTLYFHSLGINEPDVMSLTVALIESIGGLFLIFGFLTRLACVPLITVMLSALLFAHPEAFKGYEAFTTAAPFLLLYSALVVLAFGPGSLSLDALIRDGAPVPKKA